MKQSQKFGPGLARFTKVIFYKNLPLGIVMLSLLVLPLSSAEFCANLPVFSAKF